MSEEKKTKEELEEEDLKMYQTECIEDDPAVEKDILPGPSSAVTKKNRNTQEKLPVDDDKCDTR